MSVEDNRDIVAALRAVPGVADADLEPDGDGEGPGTLRLGLLPGVDEVAVATSVGRLLRERFGLGVDAERVQLIEDSEVPIEVPQQREEERSPRPSIQRMHLVSSGLDITATVTLSHHDRTCVGECTGTATQTGVQRAVATATLRSVEGLLDNKVRFELEHVEVTPTGRDRTALVAHHHALQRRRREADRRGRRPRGRPPGRHPGHPRRGQPPGRADAARQS